MTKEFWKKKLMELNLTNFKIHYKPIAIKIVYYQHKYLYIERQIYQQSITDNTEIDSQVYIQ